MDLKSAGKDAEQCLNEEQLKIYALGYQQMTGEIPDVLMIYILDHPKGPKVEKEDVKKAMIDQVKYKIQTAAKCIRDDDLQQKREERKCKKCYLGVICPK